MKIKVGVFFGGKSVEHEISVISAIQAISAFDTEKYEIIPVYITKLGEMYVGKNIGDIDYYKDMKSLISNSQKIILINENGLLNIVKYPLKKLGNNVYDYIDVAFPIVHGTNVEDGNLQGYFKTMGVPFVGCDVLSSAVGMDKYVMKTILKDNEIPVLDCCCVGIKEFHSNTKAIIQKISERIEFPVIVKPINLGSSVGIKKVSDESKLAEAIEFAFQFSNKILVEKAIVELKEVNCAVLGDSEDAEASECEEPVNNDEILSYEDKYLSSGNKSGGSKGMQSTKRKLPADISVEMRNQIRELAVKTFKILGCCGVARIDFMIDKTNNKIWVNEINTIPGSLSFYLWEPAGLKYKDLLERMISLALKRERDNKDINYSFETNILAGVKLGGMKGSKL